MKLKKLRFKKPLKLQKRFFIAYLLLSFTIVCSFSVFFYNYISNILIERETNSLLDRTLTLSQQTDKTIYDMDTVSINIEYSNLVKDKLDESFEMSSASDDFLSLSQLFVAINGTDNRIDQINLYDFNGNVIRFGLVTNVYKIDMNSLSWLTDVFELEGSKYITAPHVPDNMFHASTKSPISISLFRLFHNRYGKEVGIVETTKNCKSIFKNIDKYKRTTENSSDFYIYDSNGSLIYPYDLLDNNVSFPKYNYFSQIKKNENHIFHQLPNSNFRELITYTTSNYTGWTYISVQSEEKILAPVYHLLKIILFFSLLVFLFSMFLSLVMAKKLTKPISQLRRILNKTSIDTLGQSIIKIDTSFDEFTQLTYAFEQMSQKLKTSMNELVGTREQEIKSRSLALQSQINPHFYYNTLATIQVLAENQNHDIIKLMCKYMTSIMRYITGGNFSTVTIEAEIDYVKKYLYCMKVRYQDSLNYDIQIPREILEEEVPKLIIQPLVENALKYGTESIPPWNILLVGSVTNEGWQIKITDTGPGFSPESLEVIEKRIQEASNQIGMPDIEINGMGILNVYLRWKLYCKDDYIFEYGNTIDGHAFTIIGRKSIKKGDDNYEQQ